MNRLQQKSTLNSEWTQQVRSHSGWTTVSWGGPSGVSTLKKFIPSFKVFFLNTLLAEGPWRSTHSGDVSSFFSAEIMVMSSLLTIAMGWRHQYWWKVNHDLKHRFRPKQLSIRTVDSNKAISSQMHFAMISRLPGISSKMSHSTCFVHVARDVWSPTAKRLSLQILA